jgi:hypothetical protein
MWVAAKASPSSKEDSSMSTCSLTLAAGASFVAQRRADAHQQCLWQALAQQGDDVLPGLQLLARG